MQQDLTFDAIDSQLLVSFQKIYLKSIDIESIDQANRRIIKLLI